MPRWLSVLLLIAASGLALLVLAGVLGYRYVRDHKEELLAAGKDAMAAGAQFGRGVDQSGCVDESLRRLQAVAGITDEVKNTLFLSGCLSAAAPSAGFCDGVPRDTDLFKTVSWRSSTCAKHPEVNSDRCGRALQPWQRFCRTRDDANKMDGAPAH